MIELIGSRNKYFSNLIAKNPVKGVAKLLLDPLSKEEKIKACLDRFLADFPPVIFRAEGHSVEIPFVPLAAKSPVILSRFSGCWKREEVELTHVSYQALQVFKKFILTNRLENYLEESGSLLNIGYEFQIISLIDIVTCNIYQNSNDIEEEDLKRVALIGKKVHNLALMNVTNSFFKEKVSYGRLKIYDRHGLMIELHSQEDLATYRFLSTAEKGLHHPPWIVDIKEWVKGFEDIFQGEGVPDEIIIHNNLWEKPLVRFLNSLTSQKIKKLSLSGIGLNLNDSILKALIHFVNTHPNLLSLDLSGCELHSIAFLNGHPSLRTLNLSHNPLRSFDAPNLPALRVLDLEDTDIETGLEEFLRNCSTLRTLNLNNAYFELPGLLEALAQSKTLATLTLDYNPIDDAEPMARFLRNNGHLRYLSLHNCSLSTSSIVQIAAALEENQGLTELFFGQDPLTQEGVVSLAKAISKNRTIQLLMCYHMKGMTKEMVAQPLLAAAHDKIKISIS